LSHSRSVDFVVSMAVITPPDLIRADPAAVGSSLVDQPSIAHDAALDPSPDRG
jgi:hypothetical protein